MKWRRKLASLAAFLLVLINIAIAALASATTVLRSILTLLKTLRLFLAVLAALQQIWSWLSRRWKHSLRFKAVVAMASLTIVMTAAIPHPQDACATSAPYLYWPVYGYITTYFQPSHKAIDIAAPYGTLVRSAQSGTVIWAGWKNNGGGNVVDISNGTVLTSYNHLSWILVKVGTKVTPYTYIARIGTTGWSTGPHLHFAVGWSGGWVDPLPLLHNRPVATPTPAPTPVPTPTPTPRPTLWPEPPTKTPLPAEDPLPFVDVLQPWTYGEFGPCP
jgi:murein DD-endopeptidase MepM/ murein hydrolase activator NlpD